MLAVALAVTLAAVNPPGHGRGPSHTPVRSVPRGLTAPPTASAAGVPAAPPRGLRAPGPPAAAGEDTSASRIRDVDDALVSRVWVGPGGAAAAAAAERLRSGKLPALGSAARPEGGAGSASRGECPANGGATDNGTSCFPSEERDERTTWGIREPAPLRRCCDAPPRPCVPPAAPASALPSVTAPPAMLDSLAGAGSSSSGCWACCCRCCCCGLDGSGGGGRARAQPAAGDTAPWRRARRRAAGSGAAPMRRRCWCRAHSLAQRREARTAAIMSDRAPAGGGTQDAGHNAVRMYRMVWLSVHNGQ